MARLLLSALPHRGLACFSRTRGGHWMLTKRVFLQILWTFSIYLESVAILPQLFMISKTGEAETITTHYLFFLGLYRALYLVNWIWRFYFEGFFDLIAVVAGVVQTILYCDFFYLYITKGASLRPRLLCPCSRCSLGALEPGALLTWHWLCEAELATDERFSDRQAPGRASVSFCCGGTVFP